MAIIFLSFLGVLIISFVIYAAIKIAQYNRDYNNAWRTIKSVWNRTTDNLDQILVVYEFYMAHRTIADVDLEATVHSAMKKMRCIFELLKQAQEHVEEYYGEFKPELFYTLQTAERFCNEIVEIKEQISTKNRVEERWKKA